VCREGADLGPHGNVAADTRRQALLTYRTTNDASANIRIFK
jgi:hypothetical protein